MLPLHGVAVAPLGLMHGYLHVYLPVGSRDSYLFVKLTDVHVLQGEAFSTIHITPEESCCYASVELTGCADVDPAAFIAKVLAAYSVQKVLSWDYLSLCDVPLSV